MVRKNSAPLAPDENFSYYRVMLFRTAVARNVGGLRSGKTTVQEAP